ncbi:hypothetical protein POVWA1_045810 [Plasmodium ovale wallikeri]|uniref:Uncharacterized protein n=1 Tax=Plasmodium ovale wallikeri TaxID=864142 RepID=A0A1A8ZEX5_PLAOA|nr:hypothetical protein POVWA1_045810 [Plasmodium ovale wallikeri]
MSHYLLKRKRRYSFFLFFVFAKIFGENFQKYLFNLTNPGTLHLDIDQLIKGHGLDFLHELFVFVVPFLLLHCSVKMGKAKGEMQKGCRKRDVAKRDGAKRDDAKRGSNSVMLPPCDIMCLCTS